MKKLLLTIILFSLSISANAGFSSYKGYNSSGGVAAPIEIKNKGLRHLVVTVQFLNEPYDNSEYTNDNYESLIHRLSIEWKGQTIQTILETPALQLSELATLKKTIETNINKLIQVSKKKYRIKQDTEVVFSISDFYLAGNED